MPENKDARVLLLHQLGTYFTLRVVLACIGFALPVAVSIAGFVQCKNPPQLVAGSLSAYYHRTALFEFLTARDLFVGGLIAAAACLYAYKGFSNKENVALNMAAIFALGVALLPTGHGADALNEQLASGSCVTFTGSAYHGGTFRPKLHGVLAILFFFCLAYVSIWRSRDTLRLVPSEAKREFYNRWYVLAGLLMVASPVIAAFVSFMVNAPNPIFTFLIESVGVWAFCLYWAFKTDELRATEMDTKVAKEKVERANVLPKPPTRSLDLALHKLQTLGSASVERIVPVNDPNSVRVK